MDLSATLQLLQLGHADVQAVVADGYGCGVRASREMFRSNQRVPVLRCLPLSLLYLSLVLPLLLLLVLRLRLCNKPVAFPAGHGSVQGTDIVLLSFRRRASLGRWMTSLLLLLLLRPVLLLFPAPVAARFEAHWTPVASSLLLL